MTDQTDKKLQDVIVAQYQYRHEAEFAAGFLDDAEIPYRLQVDEAAMGMTIATPATLWVRGMDLRHALEVLDLPSPGHAAAPTPASPLPSGPAQRGEVVRKAPAALDRFRLTGTERLLAGALAVAAAGAGGFVPTGPSGSPLLMLAGVIAVVLGLTAILGRTAPVIRNVLRAISGSAP